MAFMMTLGILLRSWELFPGAYIRNFYTGLGAALTGTRKFFICFVRAVRQTAREKNQKRSAAI